MTNNAAAKPSPTPTLDIQPIARAIVEVRIEGVTPLIVHAWSAKAKGMMLAAQTSKVRSKKDARDPEADYTASRYVMTDGRDGFPAVAFKAAIVDAARLYEGIKMTELRAALYVFGEGVDMLVPLDAPASTMREDMVRVGMGTADLRYRAQYTPWAATLRVQYLPTMLSAASVIALVDASGIGGVGEWRPSKAKTGTFGTYRAAN